MLTLSFFSLSSSLTSSIMAPPFCSGSTCIFILSDLSTSTSTPSPPSRGGARERASCSSYSSPKRRTLFSLSFRGTADLEGGIDDSVVGSAISASTRSATAASVAAWENLPKVAYSVGDIVSSRTNTQCKQCPNISLCSDDLEWLPTSCSPIPQISYVIEQAGFVLLIDYEIDLLGSFWISLKFWLTVTPADLQHTCQIFPERSVLLHLLEELKKRSLGKDNLITSNKCHLLARVYQKQAELTCPSSACLIAMTTTVISTLLSTWVISLTNS